MPRHPCRTSMHSLPDEEKGYQHAALEATMKSSFEKELRFSMSNIPASSDPNARKKARDAEDKPF
ncbi:hypothetical protein PABG_12591 [Paracoccidioides brasiliensis Pb03]|nr:hypothetical protein PABG_12591 [Paracoccidioides brasiliensis Pb03]